MKEIISNSRWLVNNYMSFAGLRVVRHRGGEDNTYSPYEIIYHTDTGQETVLYRGYTHDRNTDTYLLTSWLDSGRLVEGEEREEARTRKRLLAIKLSIVLRDVRPVEKKIESITLDDDQEVATVRYRSGREIGVRVGWDSELQMITDILEAIMEDNR